MDDTAAKLHASWTTDNGSNDDLCVAERTLAGVWPASPAYCLTGLGDQDHSMVAVQASGGERAVLFHDTGAASGNIRLGLQSAGVALDLNSTNLANWPALYMRGDRIYTAWSETIAGEQVIKARNCDGTGAPANFADCDDLTLHWTGEAALASMAGHDLTHPQLAVSSDGDEFVVFEDHPAAASPPRVRLFYQCGPGRTDQMVTQNGLVDGTEADEELGWGPQMALPAITIDENNDDVVVGYVRKDDPSDEWQGMLARRPISDFCT